MKAWGRRQHTTDSVLALAESRRGRSAHSLSVTASHPSRLSDERAAMLVVHEALHHAGLSEKPLNRRCMTSLEINTLVGKKCRF